MTTLLYQKHFTALSKSLLAKLKPCYIARQQNCFFNYIYTIYICDCECDRDCISFQPPCGIMTWLYQFSPTVWDRTFSAWNFIPHSQTLFVTSTFLVQSMRKLKLSKLTCTPFSFIIAWSVININFRKQKLLSWNDWQNLLKVQSPEFNFRCCHPFTTAKVKYCIIEWKYLTVLTVRWLPGGGGTPHMKGVGCSSSRFGV